jgi:centrosomal protein CEP120
MAYVEEEEAGHLHAQQPLDDAIRNTPEYRAAWDVELWRAVQLQRLEREMKEYRKRIHEEIRHAAIAKEKETSSHLDQRARELAGRERKLVEDERVIERRKLKLAEAEREMRQDSQALQEERRRAAEECEARVQRAKEDYAHKLELQKQLVAQGQLAAQRAEDRLHAAQEDFRKLYEEHNAFRMQVAKNPDSQHVQYIETLRAQHAAEVAALSERADRRLGEAVSQLQARLLAAEETSRRLSNALAQKKEQLRAAELRAASSTAKAESLQREMNSLLRQRDVQQPSPIPLFAGRGAGGGGGSHNTSAGMVPTNGLNTSLVGDIPEIAALRDAVNRSTSLELTRLQQQKQQSSNKATNGERNFSAAREVMLAKEIERLQKERDALLHGTGGAYTLSDPIIRDVTDRIVQLQRSLATPNTQQS